VSDVAIRVSNLSKRYRIGLKEEIHDTFVGSITSWLKSPISNYRRVHSLASFSRDGEFDDVIWALNDVSFEIKRGEIVGVIGKNGAGKSTLLKILSRIVEPTKGEAIVKGNVSSLLEVGTGFHPELTGRENLYLNGALLGMKSDEIDRKFDEIVDFSGIGRFIDTPVKRYSSGMYVRLAFSIAAHLEPDILLIDEVLAVGDIEFQRKCLGKMDEVAKGGRTVLFVSHNMGSIGRLCKTAMLIEGGKIVQQGDVDKIITQYVKSSANNTSNNIGSANFSNVLDKKACIKSIRVLDDEGKEKTVFDQSKPFMIEVSFYVNEPAKVYASVTLSTADDTVRIFSSREIESNKEAEVRREPGEYSSRLEFPGGILNLGVFYARVGIKSMGVSYDKKHSPSFELVDYGDVGNYQTTLKPRKRGVLAFQIQWTSIKLNTEKSV
jgi:lipopolysaccharide transport system ATP-binding protein